MKAVVVSKPGGPEVLELKDVPTPKPCEGWSLVRVMGFGVNHSEVFTRQGLSPSVSFPRILGIECAGIIEQSSDEKNLPTGQKVVSIMGEMGRAFDGSYAEYVLLPNEQIYPVKSNLPWDQLAALPETYYTAYVAFKSLRIEDGNTVLVRGATSGMGPAFLSLVKARFPQARVTGSTRSLAKAEQLTQVGFDAVVQEKDGKLITDQSYDRVLELIGPATVKDTLAHTNEDGIVCSCGQLGGKWFLEDFDPIIELQGNKCLTTSYSGLVSARRMQEMLDFVERHNVEVGIGKVFDLEHVADAHRRIESGGNFGKNVVLVEQDRV